MFAAAAAVSRAFAVDVSLLDAHFAQKLHGFMPRAGGDGNGGSNSSSSG